MIFLFGSTQEVHGPRNNDELIQTETSACEPSYFYGQTKLDAEQAVIDYSMQHRIPALIFRITGVVGVGDEYAAFETIRAASLGLMMVYPGACTGKNTFVHVDDVVQAIQLVIARASSKPFNTRGIRKFVQVTKLDDNIYIIGPSESMTFKETIDTCCKELGWFTPLCHVPLSLFQAITQVISVVVNFFRSHKKSFLFHPDTIAAMNQSRWYSSAKAMRDLQYKPISCKEAFQKTIQAELKSNRLIHAHRVFFYVFVVLLVLVCIVLRILLW